MDFSTLRAVSPLGPAAWAVLAGIPVSIIALYFLKLRRRPVRVPSTMLWRRGIEDLRVNSLFQRLRRNLLLFLQLLMVGLLMLALAGFRMAGESRVGVRRILIVDNSASMSANDVVDAKGDPTTRLELAKAKAREVLDRMASGDLTMIIAFADRAQVVSNYTSDARELRKRLDAVGPTGGTTSLRDALQVAGGLANPSKLIEEESMEGRVAVEVTPPDVLIFTDGGFPDVAGFSLGNLRPRLVVIGPPPPPANPDGSPPAATPSNNVAILALRARRNAERPEEFQVFGLARNHRAEEVSTTARLYLRAPDAPGAMTDENAFADAVELSIPPGGEQSFQFDRALPEGGALVEVRVPVEDALAIDNRAYAVVGDARKARILVVTEGNRFLERTLNTETAKRSADIAFATPAEADGPELSAAARSGEFDLVIYDGHRPKEHPAANTLYFGEFPPSPAYDGAREVRGPLVLDWDLTHPMMQYIRDLRVITILKARALDVLPDGARPLIEGDGGTLAFLAPREGFRDAVLGFKLIEDRVPQTNWPTRISFPIFLLNALRTLGNVEDADEDKTIRPGDSIAIRAAAGVDRVVAIDPSGAERTLERSPQSTFVHPGANEPGFLRARWDGGSAVYAVNLFDARESDLATRGVPPEGLTAELAEDFRIKVGENPLEAAERYVPDIRQWWKPFAILALAVLLLEWYVYNRRVYI